MNWKIIDEFPDYEVSDLGQVRNSQGRVLRTFIQNGGYEVASFPNGSKTSAKRTVHRLVALAFIDNPTKYKVVNHKDGNKLNNRVDNLEWCTQYENCQHAILRGLKDYNYPTKGKKLPPRSVGGVTSIYFGVSYRKPKGGSKPLWTARTQKNNKCLWQKTFGTELEAALYHDEQVKLHGIDRPLNFPVC